MQNARFKACAMPLMFLTSVNTTEKRYRSQAFAAVALFVKCESVHGAFDLGLNIKFTFVGWVFLMACCRKRPLLMQMNLQNGWATTLADPLRQG
jgi:hypothetical protein